MCKLIDIMVPDIPQSLDIKIKRERYLAKEALQDAEHVKDRQRRQTERPDMESDDIMGRQDQEEGEEEAVQVIGKKK